MNPAALNAALAGDQAVKRTTVRPEDEHDQKRRQGFVPICCYGRRIEPEENEIGGIFKDVRNARIERGMEVHDAECVERIFVASSGGD